MHRQTSHVHRSASVAGRALLLILGLATVTPAYLATPAPADASHSTTVSLSASTTGSSASITAVRDGWGATIRVAVRDTKADGYCAFATVSLNVSGGSDPNSRTENCSGLGSVRLRTFRLSAGAGTGISQVSVKACRNIPWASDNCASTTITLPQMHAHASADRIAATDAIMRLSLASFQTRKNQAAPPYDWNDDGCSVPGWLPFTSAFNLACERHDFGYRNFGRDNDYHPSDGRRSMVDSQFLADMRAICVARYTLRRPLCYASANAGYALVREFGGDAFFGED